MTVFKPNTACYLACRGWLVSMLQVSAHIQKEKSVKLKWFVDLLSTWQSEVMRCTKAQ